MTNGARLHSRLEDLMRLPSIRRWGIVEVSRPQSVAEHSFRVAVLVLEFWRTILCRAYSGYEHHIAWRCLEYALVHDGAEARTGDIDGHFKRCLPPDIVAVAEKEVCPWLANEPSRSPEVYHLVKLMDVLETYLYLKRWGVDPDVRTYLGELWAKVEQIAKEVDKGWGLPEETSRRWMMEVVERVK